MLICSGILSLHPNLSSQPNDFKLKALYNSLDPYSVAQHLAFYELYYDRPIGRQALQEAWKLLSGQSDHSLIPLNEYSFSPSIISSLVNLINRPTDQQLTSLSPQDLIEIEKLSRRLVHHRLKGHFAQNEAEVLALSPAEIDLARGLFLSHFGNDLNKVQTYEAFIDLMALQILARLPDQSSAETKIRTINQFIFDEMGFRFPPHSLSTKQIEAYTCLPSVLDSHRGVCLGVSILYLCIAQRLGLPLETITPPGHIYIRYRDTNNLINIETTARGLHLDSDDYLNVGTRSLPQRNIKEVIGLAHFNQAAGFWQQQAYEQALKTYQTATCYLPSDPLVKELLGYTYLCVGQKDKGEALLETVKDHLPDYAVVKETIAEDYLNGSVDIESLKVLFLPIEEDRQSILNRKQQLETIVQNYPDFRSGYFHLAMAWIQLHRMGEALNVLEAYHAKCPNDPESNYYMAILYAQRKDYQRAWKHLTNAERITHSRQHTPKVLKELRRELLSCCPALGK
jgi:regulator of sirC expression with transglutaminase-like and TPR domain